MSLSPIGLITSWEDQESADRALLTAAGIRYLDVYRGSETVTVEAPWGLAWITFADLRREMASAAQTGAVARAIAREAERDSA